jgi:4-carboxymuconolactone decarboxylase
MLPITAILSTGNCAQLAFHLHFGRQNGLTRTDISEIITHLAFYVGWPKAWSAFNIAMPLFPEE